ALGGRPAASFAKRLMLPVSNDTVLRVVRARACPRTEPLNVVGIDDWAFRRNHSYGTIVCDLERRRIVTLLPDREMATVLIQNKTYEQPKSATSNAIRYTTPQLSVVDCLSDTLLQSIELAVA